MPGRKWTAEEKANIVLEILTTSTSTAEICRKYNVRPTLVYTWRASFVHAGTRGLSGTDVSIREKQLEQENSQQLYCFL
jgi:transposase-like protein